MSFVMRPRSQIREREEVADRVAALHRRIAHLERVENALAQEAAAADSRNVANRLRASLVRDDLARARSQLEALVPLTRAFAPAAAERPSRPAIVDPTDEVVEIELPDRQRRPPRAEP